MSSNDVSRLCTLYIEVVAVLNPLEFQSVVLLSMFSVHCGHLDMGGGAAEFRSIHNCSVVCVAVQWSTSRGWPAAICTGCYDSKGQTVHRLYQTPLVCCNLRVSYFEILELFLCYVSCCRDLLVFHISQLLHSANYLFPLALYNFEHL
jgi:hypothetical protein